MKTHFSKVAFLFGLYAALHFTEACINCNCGTEVPYFDYHKISLSANGPQIDPGDSFELFILPDSVEFVAQTCPDPTFFSTSALACSCTVAGDFGDKYDYDQLDILANKDYNDTLPAGTSLNQMFEVDDGSDVAYRLPIHTSGRFEYYESPLHLILLGKPILLNVPYRFTVRLIKSTGDTLTAETGEVYFQ
jgi:hypothetical protein